MPKDKKLLIAIIILGAMFPIFGFGLSIISEAFLVPGMFCGTSAFFCLIIYLDLKAGRKPKLIPVGLGMTFLD